MFCCPLLVKSRKEKPSQQYARGKKPARCNGSERWVRVYGLKEYEIPVGLVLECQQLWNATESILDSEGRVLNERGL